MQCWSRDMINFDFLVKGLRIVSPAHFVYDFFTKILPMLHSINWTNFTAWLLLVLAIWAICLLQLFANQVVTSGILKLTLSFWSSHFFYMRKKSRKNLNIWRTERASKMKWKALFIIFKGLSVNQKLSQTLENAFQ